MKKIMNGLILTFVTIFTFSVFGLNVKADSGLVDLYPQGNPGFEEQYGNSNWVLEYHGHRWNMVSRSTKHVSQFRGNENQDKTEFVGLDVPEVHYKSGSGIVIYNDTTLDVTITVDGDGDNPRAPIADQSANRFWAYFDEEGKLYMYEDEFINAHYLTKVEGQNYWKLSTETEIESYKAAEEKPANMVHKPIRIKLNEDGETYKAEPVNLHWTVSDVEGEEYKSAVTGKDSRHVVVPKGHTVVGFGEMARNDAVIDWVKEFPALIASSSEEKAVFKYIDQLPYFAGLAELNDNPTSEMTYVVAGYNSEVTNAALTAGLSARYIDEESDIKGKGKNAVYKFTNYEIDVIQDGVVLETVTGTYNTTTEAYEVSELSIIDTSKFGNEYNLVYRAVSPVDGTLIYEEDAVLSVGVLAPTINGLENKTIDVGSYVDLFDGLTATDIENDVDITDSLVITHEKGFNPNYVTYGRHKITVQASWNYYVEANYTFKYPETANAAGDVFTFRETLGNLDTKNAGVASQPPALFTSAMVEELVKPAVKAQFEAWGRVTSIFNAEGKLLTKLDRFASTVPYVIGENGESVLMTGYKFEDWIQQYLVGDAFLIHTHGGATSAEGRAMVVGESLVGALNPRIDEDIVTVRTFDVIGFDSEAPVVEVISKTFEISADNNYTSINDALEANIRATDNVKVSSITFSSPGLNVAALKEAGEYTVTVGATDNQGNSATTKTFTLIIKEAKADQTAVEDLLGEVEDLETSIGELETTIDNLNKDLNAAKKANTTTLIVAIVVSVVVSGLAFGGAVLLTKKRA